MMYHGHVENGRIILDDSVALPDGLKVEVMVRHPQPPPADSNEEASTLYERLKPAIGTAKGLPADAARNVDHYLYGHPKR